MSKASIFVYTPNEQEAETASNSYLMSLIAIIVGLPLPIINLIATAIFYLSNRKGTYFVRWHCTQALLSQLTLVPLNSIGFWWTLSILFSDRVATNEYFAYLLTVFLFNLLEFFATVYSAIQTRKGIHVQWWFHGPLTQKICREVL
jgi:uncharacterized Tic20 family protein